MRTVTCLSCLLLLLLSSACFAAEPAAAPDIRRAVPGEAHMVVYGQHNPERDYQAAYLAAIWQTVEDERLIERALEIGTSRMSQEDLDSAKSVLDELKAAVEPIDWKTLSDCREAVYFQVMETPFNHQQVIVRLTPEAAASCEVGVKNLLALIERRTGGELPVRTDNEGSVEITYLGLPAEVPFQPAIARLGDVLVLSTSVPMVRQSLARLAGTGGDSKFDDPRLKEALAQLPTPEDSLVFFDGRRLFAQLRGIGPFIRQVSQGDSNAERVAEFIDLIMDEVAILDYEVTVEYTEEYRNRSMAYGKLMPDADQKVLHQMLGTGKPFDDWQRWIPADAVSYSLSTGANLHPLYVWAMETIPKVCPEAQEGLDQFEQFQQEIGVHLDRDILQAFTGESVSISLPAAAPSQLGGLDSVLAMRCEKPDRIRELLHELMARLAEIPAVRAQNLKMAECKDLEGFEEISAPMLAMLGARPVVGFHDGWMMIGSNAAAVGKVLDTLAGKSPAIDATDAYEQFGLEIDGPVESLKYENLAENTRQTAKFIRQAGFVAPTILALAGAHAESDDLKVVQEILALLPSVATIVEKFDYLEEKLSVTQEGDAENTYVTRSVTRVRPPAEPGPGETNNEASAATTER